MIRFYAPGLPDNPVLPESESGHAVRVLRMRAGDPLDAVDGRGNLYHCTIIDDHPKRAMVRIESVETISRSWPGTITLAIAPTKNNDRMEWLVEKLVEMGIDRIVPLRCQRSERKDINVERLAKIAVSAMKQSLKATMPEIDPVTPFARFIEASEAPHRFMGYCDQSVERHVFAREYLPGSDTAILIGPEGDFDPQEVGLALGRGWIPVTFGDSRLRTETAALYAVAACHVLDHEHL